MSKRLFDAIRAMLGRGMTQREVNAINEALVVPVAPSLPEVTYTPKQTSRAGVKLIGDFEGYARKLSDGRCKAYPDPGTGGAPWTIGYGATTDFQGRPIKPGTIWTRQQALDRKALHLREFEGNVIAGLGDAIHGTSQEQFDALVSFTYNVGPKRFLSSTLLRRHKAGDFSGAAREFSRWNKAAGRVLRGLTRRRAAEAALYRRGM